jgi:hypothetical protein
MFKVGDKVRITGNANDSRIEASDFGRIVTVARVVTDEGDDYFAENGGGYIGVEEAKFYNGIWFQNVEKEVPDEFPYYVYVGEVIVAGFHSEDQATAFSKTLNVVTVKEGRNA